MIETPKLPTIWIMTTLAVRAKGSLVCRIIVTSAARFCRVLVGLRAMAILAWHNRMETNQRKLREIVIKNDLLAPIGLVVATFTALSKLPIMGVIRLVTGHTGHWQFISEEIAFVAAVAFNLFMSAFKREQGRLGVVEAYGLPLFWRMTGLAFLAIPAAMDILNLVAINASVRQVFVAFTNVAHGAFDGFMCPFEGKLSF